MFVEETDIEFYEFNDFRLETASRRLFNKNKIVFLSPRIFDLLLLLLQNSGKVLTKETILNHIWAEQFVEENNLTVTMSALRKSLGEKRGKNIYIETISRYGYRFVADVRKVRNLKPEPENDAETFDSLAVLPFINENKDANLDYLCDGLTESIINQLSQLKQIRVIARSTVFRYRESEFDLQSIGRRLNIQAVLIGRIRRAENDLILSLELINVRDQRQIWGNRYNYGLSDLLNLEEEIAKEVSERLRITLTKDERSSLSKRYTQNSEAHLLYLKGRYFWNKRNIKEIKRAIEYFERAIDKDPDYALAYLGLADCFSTFFAYAVLPPNEIIPKAEAAIIKALEIDNLLTEAHVSLVHLRSHYHPDRGETEKEFKRSIELNNNYALAHLWYAGYLAMMGRFDEALLEMKQAQKLDPLSPAINNVEAKILYLSRQYDESISKCLEVLELDPNFVPARVLLGFVYLGKQMYEEALREFKETIELSSGFFEFQDIEDKHSFSEFQKRLFSSGGDPELIAGIGYIYAVTGKRNEALEIVEGLEYLSKCMYIESDFIAIIYSTLGDKDKAFEWLDKAFADKSVTLRYLKVWSLFDSLRPDPRFEDLQRRMNLTS